MILHKNETASQVSCSLQFTLLAEDQLTFDYIMNLRKAAIEKFSKVTKIYRFFADSCKIKSSEDPFLETKLMGMGLIMKSNRIVSVLPKSIVGFGYLMPNGIVGQLALATYPEKVILKDKTAFELPFHNMSSWHGLVETGCINKNCKPCNDCIESHTRVCELLDKAKEFNILEHVYDTTDYWNTKNIDSIFETCCSNKIT